MSTKSNIAVPAADKVEERREELSAACREVRQHYEFGALERADGIKNERNKNHENKNTEK